MENGYYTYVLQGLKDGKKYTGYTKDLKLRLREKQEERGVRKTLIQSRDKTKTKDIHSPRLGATHILFKTAVKFTLKAL